MNGTSKIIVSHRGKLGNGEWQTGQYLVEGVKAIKCFQPRMLTSLMARVNTN